MINKIKRAKLVRLTELIKNYYPDYSNDKIKSLIVCKNVYVNGELVSDFKIMVPSDSKIEVIFNKYVSRGGFKLEKALRMFEIDVRDKVVLDAGSSTGGFTDCLLKNGASLVHSVDVGYNLIDYSLRIDKRVLLHEKTNIMSVTSLNPIPSMATLDLSFRSVRRAAKHILDLTLDHIAIALIKPQFEVPPGEKDFNGVIKSLELLKKVMVSVYKILEEDEVGVFDICSSPITGHKGNKEFLALLSYKNNLINDYMTSPLPPNEFIKKCGM